ncbi:S41 family peptidase [uncultured Kordia sp.]|uniref:S41 family peptidase n=1 Tax=uncultured Kordia sp. TaxID=507699 RepID=UPI00262D19AB|nr:S41 family peptidase [uncultured Kordia sp.]
MKINNIILFVLSLFFFNSCQTETQKSIKEALVKNSYSDIDTAIVFYNKLKNENPNAYNFADEKELNNLGYQLLSDGRTEDAIKIFKLLVAEFPNSFNAYDSLGEVYFLNGNIELALKNYRKSLELNPKNENAERYITNIDFENRNKNKFYKIYPKQQYLDDLDELANTVTTENPHPYKFMSKEDFWRIVKDKKASITNNTTYSEFIWSCSEIVANINCGHSSLWYFNQEREMLPSALRFPLEARLINNKFYVSDPLINNVQVGSEILTINGKSIHEIKEDIFRHISSQGKIETTKKIFLNSYFTAYIPYALHFPKSYTITIKGKGTPIKLAQLTRYTPKPRYFPTNLCESKELCLDFVNDNTAVLTIINSAYYGSSFSIFKEFIGNSFQEINSKKIEHLIIDMRSNGGGPSNTGIHLLRHLTKEAFIYKKVAEGSDIAQKSFKPFESNFKGKLYFLIDGESASTSGHVLSIVKDLKLGTIIGEEMGGNHFCTGGQKRFKLTNTDVFYSVGRFTNISAVNTNFDDRGVMPDYVVTQSIQDYTNDVDTVMEYTMQLIQKTH